MTPISRKAAAALRYKAATDPLHGRITSSHSAEWDVSGRCTEPKRLLLEGARDPDGNLGFATNLEVRCRKCEACKAERRDAWAARMRAEMHVSPRTWFVTLTMRPSEHHRARTMARKLIAERQLLRLPNYEKTQELAGLIRVEQAEVIKYLKRVRKGGYFKHEKKLEKLFQEPTHIRYFVTVELHKSGLPHYHLLIHEVAGYPALSRRWLAHQWPHGYGAWKIANLQHARYVAKYLAKEIALARVRASRRYGERSESIAAQLVGGVYYPQTPLSGKPLTEKMEG